MNKFTKPNFNIYMEEFLMIIKRLCERIFTLIKNVFAQGLQFYNFFITNDPYNE